MRGGSVADKERPVNLWGWLVLAIALAALAVALSYIAYLHRGRGPGRSVGPAAPAAVQDSRPANAGDAGTGGRIITVGMTLSFLVYLLLFGGMILVVLSGRGSQDASLTLPVILVGGVGIFIDTLAAMTLIFWRIGLADRRYPLGMPDGSIRAIIALSLILLFAIMAVFLYVDLGTAPPQSPRADIAKQLVTTLGTLVVALASFYFGASTTVTGPARGDGDRDAEGAGQAGTPRAAAGTEAGSAVKQD